MDERELVRLRDEVQALRRELECLKNWLKRGFMQMVGSVEHVNALDSQQKVPRQNKKDGP